jgi:hypothetical protein
MQAHIDMLRLQLHEANETIAFGADAQERYFKLQNELMEAREIIEEQRRRSDSSERILGITLKEAGKARTTTMKAAAAKATMKERRDLYKGISIMKRELSLSPQYFFLTHILCAPMDLHSVFGT